MDSGLDYIVENKDYVAKLGTALESEDQTVKKQVFDLMTALCAHSTEGYKRAFETLEHYMNLKSERYRLKFVVTELDMATAVEYQIALLTFINCVIISAQTLSNRIKIRNEFIGLNLLPVLNNLRKIYQNVNDIKIQLEVFDEQRESDEAQSLQDPDGINLSSHLDVFYAILRQVADTPQGFHFLSILQHLLRIDSKDQISDVIWETAEMLVHRATLLENREDSFRVNNFPCLQCRGGRKQSLAPLIHNIPVCASMSAVPPSLLSGGTAPPPPPPPPPPPRPPSKNSVTVTSQVTEKVPVVSIPLSNIPPPPPPHMLIKENLREMSSSERLLPKITRESSDAPECPAVELLPQQETPVPKSKMKTINWNKIPSNKVRGNNNIWTMVATNRNSDKIKSSLDWEEIEGLFCQQATNSAQGSPKLGRDRLTDLSGSLERKKKDQETNLLDGKRSLNVNIFLKQFRSSNEHIILLIKNGDHDEIGAEKLRGLLKILPEVDELDMLKSFDGDRTRLGNAEKFLLELMQLSNYKLRIECMLLKEDFAVNIGYLEPAIRAMLYAGEDLMTNKALQEVLYMVLVTGNFLNSGGYAGNAAGVKLSSLQKLTDIRANKPGMNLIHYVALQAEKASPELLKFPDQLTTLENASKTSVEQLNNELTALVNRIRKIKNQIESPQTQSDIKEQMKEFVNISEREVVILQNYMKELTNLRKKLADFFIEDPNTFKMEECYKIFQSFRERFKQALIENERRRFQEEQASLRRKMREEQLNAKRKMNLQLDPSSSLDSNYLGNPLQFPVSPALSRRRMGSFNTHNELGSPRSPEGSLRRRKSRDLNEDETLMDFLRQSGQEHVTRERKSYGGSLDRSWARRNRSDSGSRKRPDLFKVDFNVDRERANSPAIPVDYKDPVGGESTKARIPKEWHQKIQTWLQHNDEGKTRAVDYKKTRVSNRRSCDEDSESDRSKLDPLPEEPSKRLATSKGPSSPTDTDIVVPIEAIQEAQSKSSSTSEWTNGTNGSRLSNEKCTSPLLESIIEENKRKKVIQELGRGSGNENMNIYFRQPVDIQREKINGQTTYNVNSEESGPHSITSAFHRSPSIDIDSYNIKNPSDGTNEEHKAIALLIENDGEPLGNGQFDRFSSARKTRRYKRPALGNGVSDDQFALLSSDPKVSGTGTNESSPIFFEPSCSSQSPEDKEARQKRWQERLKSLDQQNDVIGGPTIANNIVSLELNDEGFEESQSLVSDTPSQSKDNNTGTGALEIKGPIETQSSSVERERTPTSCENQKKPTAANKLRNTPLGNLVRRTQSLSLRCSPTTVSEKRPNIPIHKNSLRKNDSDSRLSVREVLKKIPVKKSNSRNSLLSSTVKRESQGTNQMTATNAKSDSKIPSAGSKVLPTPPNTTSTALSAMRSSHILSPCAAAQQLKDQMKRTPFGNNSDAKLPVPNRGRSRLNVNASENYPLKEIQSFNNSRIRNAPTAINSSQIFSTRPSPSLSTTSTRTTPNRAGSSFMRPTASSSASSVTKASIGLGGSGVSSGAKSSRFR